MLLICVVIDAITGPYNCAIMATGRIKKSQLIISLSFIIDLLISFYLVRIGVSPRYILISRIMTRGILNMIIGLIFMRFLFSFNVLDYMRKVLFPISLLLLIVVPVPIYFSFIISDWQLLLFTTLYIFIASCLTIYFVIMDSSERIVLKRTFSDKINKYNTIKL